MLPFNGRISPLKLCTEINVLYDLLLLRPACTEMHRCVEGINEQVTEGQFLVHTEFDDEEIWTGM